MGHVIGLVANVRNFGCFRKSASPGFYLVRRRCRIGISANTESRVSVGADRERGSTHVGGSAAAAAALRSAISASIPLLPVEVETMRPKARPASRAAAISMRSCSGVFAATGVLWRQSGLFGVVMSFRWRNGAGDWRADRAGSDALAM